MTHAPTRVTDTLRTQRRAEGRVTIQEAATAVGVVHSTLYRRLRLTRFVERDSSGTYWVDAAALALDQLARGDAAGAGALRALVGGTSS